MRFHIVQNDDHTLVAARGVEANKDDPLIVWNIAINKVTHRALEAAGVEFTNGERPGVRLR